MGGNAARPGGVGGLRLAEHVGMSVEEFLKRVEVHPRLKLVHVDGTMCIIRCSEDGGSRDIRLGFWAVAGRQWEQLLDALRIPSEASVA